MDIRPIGKNELTFPIKIKKKKQMVDIPKENPLFPKKWTSVIITTKEDKNGEETKRLGR